MSYFILKQLPVPSPHAYREDDQLYLAERVAELVCTSEDLRALADDAGVALSSWCPQRRQVLRAELDAYYAHLYGLTRDELRYILDPKDVFGADFPSETFRVLKEREQKELGEYRTRRLVLEAFDKLAETDRFRNEMASRKSAFEVPAKQALVAVQ
jgi:hypothetical protein